MNTPGDNGLRGFLRLATILIRTILSAVTLVLNLINPGTWRLMQDKMALFMNDLLGSSQRRLVI